MIRNRIALFSQLVLVSTVVLISQLSRLHGQNSPAPTSAQEAAAEAETVDPSNFPTIVARVNEAEITRNELIGRVGKRQAERQLPQGKLPAEAYRSVLDQAIDMELLYQSSISSNLVATQEQIAETLDRLRGQFPDEETFSKGLAARGLSLEDAKDQIRKDLSIQKLIQEKISSRVTIDEAKKRSFYEENQERMQQPEHLEISHILIAVDQETSEEEALAEANRIRNLISSGEMDFAEAAREYSDDAGSKSKDGLMTVTKGVTVPPFEKAAFSLELEELSEPVKTRFGYHLIQVHKKNPPRTIPFEEISPTIQKVLERQGLQEELQNEIEKLRSEADIEIFI